MKKKALLSSVLTIVLCLSLIAGSTFALFTSEAKVNVAVTSGKVDVTATIDEESLALYSPKAIDLNGEITDTTNVAGETFFNGGTAVLDGSTLTLSGITPGDKAEFTINIENNSNVKIQYRTVVSYTDNNGLFKGLKFNIGGTTVTNKSDWSALEAGADISDLVCSVELPANAGNSYQGKTCTLVFTVEAVQSNTAPRDLVQTNSHVGTTYNGTTTTLNAYDFVHTFQDNESDGMAVYVTNGAKLTLNDSTLNAAVSNDTGKRSLGFYLYKGAELTINSGTYNLNSQWGVLVWAQGTATARCKVTINGGTFKITGDSNSSIISAYSNSDVSITGGFFDLSAGNPNVTLQWQNDSTMTVTGGTFVNYNPAGRGIVPEGYTVVASEQTDGTTWYEVVPEA